MAEQEEQRGGDHRHDAGGEQLFRLHRIGRVHLIDGELHRKQFLVVAEVEKRREIIVILSDKAKQDLCNHGGLDEGKNNCNKNSAAAHAVENRRFLVVLGKHADIIEEKEHHHRRTAHRGDHDRQGRAHPFIKVGEHDVGRDHDDNIGNDKRRHHTRENNLAAGEIQPRETVSGERAHKHADEHGRDDISERIEKGTQNHRLLKHGLIIFPRPVFGKKVGKIDLLRRLEGGGQQIDEGQKNEQGYTRYGNRNNGL